MKQVLSLLTAFVFLQMQTWALSGGPVYPTGAPNQAGFYSGVLEQQDSLYGEDFENNSGSVQPEDSPAGSIGVYSLTIPSNTVGGLATGTMFLFVNGTLFASNNFSGVADPDKGTFDAILDLAAVPALTDSNGNPVNPVAEGMMRTKIVEENTTPLPGNTSTATGHAARMKGNAVIDVSLSIATNFTPSPLVRAFYSVSGYRNFTTSP
jgi:hypothetical protein